MSRLGDKLADAASELVGVPFRLYGRSAEFGLDCIGVVACAIERTGSPVVAPASYSLRNAEITPHLALAISNGLTQAIGEIEGGDILLVAPGPGQHHLLIALNSHQFVHAHAGLGRVVITPGPLPWPIEKHWRLSASN